MGAKRFVIDLFSKTSQGDVLFGLLDLRKRYLTRQGWIRSYASRTPVNVEGNPIPWFSYSSIAFLTDRLNADLKVFEYGSGNSTLWLSKRVEKVVSVEHETGWFEMIKEKLGRQKNVEYLFRDLENGDYVAEISKYENEFDVVIIDGRQRAACALGAVHALTEAGVIIWDNAEREQYQEGQQQLMAQGFRRLDFHGLGPINSYASSTTVFYRDGNCLGI